MPHTAGKTVAMYFQKLGSQWLTFANFCPMRRSRCGDGEAPVVQEFKYLGSMLSKNFDDSVTIMATGQNQISADSIHEAAKGNFRDEARSSCA